MNRATSLRIDTAAAVADVSDALVHRLDPGLFEPLLPALLALGRALPWDLDPGPASDHPVADALRRIGPTELQAAMAAAVAHHTRDKRNFRLGDDRVMDMASAVCTHLTATGIASVASLSGKMAYPPGGWLGWHSNSDQPGWRLYIVYVRDGGRSGFRWWDGDTIRDDEDIAGLNFRLFRIRPEPRPFWHAVYAGEWRLSLGFRLDDLADFALESAVHAGTARPGQR